MIRVHADALEAITGRAAAHFRPDLITAINECLPLHDITTPLRVAHFLAQVCHESGGFRYMEEIASGEAYEGRLDLGNSEVGDGPRFKGRGAIQLTGRLNYAAYSAHAGIDFVRNPERLSILPHAVYVAGWFWESRGLNFLADADDVEKITRRINGGLNGLDDRKRYLARAKALFLPIRLDGGTSSLTQSSTRPSADVLPNALPTLPDDLLVSSAADRERALKPSKPWYKSKGILGVISAALPLLADGISPADVVTLAGLAVGLYGRVKADSKITL